MTIGDVFLPLPGPETMREWDAETIAEFGIPAILLMENAARSAFAFLREKMSLTGKSILLFMGKGNNGGDAAALARMLHEARASVLVCHAYPLEGVLDGDKNDLVNPAFAHIRWAHASGVEFLRINPAALELPESFKNPCVMVDGLLGTGFTPPVREDMQQLFASVNKMRRTRRDATVLALDLPSGMDAVTGQPLPIAIKADATITFEAGKPGMYSHEGRELCGEIRIAPVGIPEKVKNAARPRDYGIGRGCAALMSSPTPEMHKGVSGHVLVAGGSENFSGAPVLSALGAFRAGAGLVTIAAPETILPGIRAALPDSMSMRLERLTEAAEAGAYSEFSKWRAIVVGPGLGTEERALRMVSAVLHAKHASPSSFPPLVLDADALNILSMRPELLKLLAKDDVLTPHPGEMARLLGIDAADVQKDRRKALRLLCKKCHAVIVLKGAYTLLSSGEEPVLHSPFDIPALAVGGSGDVLSGALGAFLARKSASNLLKLPLSRSLALAAVAVYVHALAGQYVEDAYPERGNLPSEIAGAVSVVRARLRAPASEQLQGALL